MSHVPGLQVLGKSVLYWQRHRSSSLVMAWPEILGSWPHDLTWDPVHGEHAEMGRH